MMLYRALIKTHHMTSRKKITAITKAAKKCNCAVYLKSGGHPPGVMVGECGGEYVILSEAILPRSCCLMSRQTCL